MSWLALPLVGGGQALFPGDGAYLVLGKPPQGEQAAGMLNKAAASSSVRLTFSHIGIFTVLNYLSSFCTVALAFGGGMNRFRRFRESYNRIICTSLWRGDYAPLTRGKIIEVKCFKSP